MLRGGGGGGGALGEGRFLGSLGGGDSGQGVFGKFGKGAVGVRRDFGRAYGSSNLTVAW